jgi:hypothetical protein
MSRTGSFFSEGRSDFDSLSRPEGEEKKSYFSRSLKKERSRLSFSSNSMKNFSKKTNLNSSFSALNSSDPFSNNTPSQSLDKSQSSTSLSRSSNSNLHSSSTNSSLRTSGDNSSLSLKNSSSLFSKPVKPFSTIAYELLNFDNLESFNPEEAKTLKANIQQAIESWQQTERLEAQVLIALSRHQFPMFFVCHFLEWNFILDYCLLVFVV